MASPLGMDYRRECAIGKYLEHVDPVGQL